MLLVIFLNVFLAGVIAIPAGTSSSTSMSFSPLPSSFTNPVNETLLYTSDIQKPKPLNVQATGLNLSSVPLLINTTLPKAHSLVNADISCTGPVASNPSTFWREEITHNGIAPLVSDTTYEVYRTAVQWGADNTGVNDASGAINAAIIAWSRTANGVSTRPAYIYVPAGTYKISHSINMLVNTWLVGDPLNMPTFVADSSLGTDAIIYGYDPNQGSGSATKNFYMAVRNIILDTRSISTSTNAVALNWAVSQGCSLYNVQFVMPDFSDHIGVTMQSDSGGGSGTIISDCSFTGGAIGVQLNNQQYNLKGLSFNGCNVGVYISSVFVGTFQNMTFENCNYGVDMSNENSVGAISIIDSSVSSCNAGVYTAVTGNGEGSLVLDNFSVGPNVIGVKSTSGSALVPGSVPAGETWVMGNENPQNYQSGTTYQINRPVALVQNGKYFTMKQPQYEEYDVSQFVNVKSVPGITVYGDNSHDDSAAINSILATYAGCKIVFFPQGIYKVASTVFVPAGSIIVGEVFSVISGIGSNFWNPDAPIPVVQVGNSGDVGVAQITDMLFSVADVLQGAIILEVNIAGSSPGDVGFWNTGIRVGGSADTLVNTNCEGTDTIDCKAAFALMHVTSTASPYIENMWGWVADHSLENGGAQNIAVGRGALIESTQGTWLVGTAFEHSTMYQFNLNKAQNVFIGMQQTENPYWQGYGSTENAPSPWTALSAYGDPSFSNCATQGLTSDPQCYRAWGHHMSSSSNIVIHGSALWVFFDGMNANQWTHAACDDHGNICQVNMAFISGATSTFWYNAMSKQTTNLIYDTTGSTGVHLASQLNNPGGWGAVVAAYLRDSGISSEQ